MAGSDGGNAFTPQYNALIAMTDDFCKALPITDLLPKMISKGVIDFQDYADITNSSKPTNRDKVELFIGSKLIGEMEIGNNGRFFKFIDVMKESPKCNFLVKRMKDWIAHYSGESTDSGSAGATCNEQRYDSLATSPMPKDKGATGVDRVDSTCDTEVVEDPLYTGKDLRKKYDDSKAEKIMLHYDRLTAQQEKIMADVQAILVVVNETEFLATMCYLKPPDHQKAVLKVQCKTIVGPNTDPRLFYVGKFGACPVAVTQVSQGQGKDAVYHATKTCFPRVVLIAAVGVAAGFPEAGVKLGDVLISDRIHDVSLYKSKDDSSIPRGSILPCSKLMLQILKDHHDWKFPCADSEDITRNSSVEIGLILSRSELLDDSSERKKLLKSFGPEAKGFEMEGFGIMQSNIDCIVIKGVCDFAGSKNKKWQPTAALAANDYLHHHLDKTDLSLLLENKKDCPIFSGHGLSKPEVQQPRQQREHQQPEEEEQQRPQQQIAQATAMDTRIFEPKECGASGYDTPDSRQQRATADIDASGNADDKFERDGVNCPQSNGAASQHEPVQESYGQDRVGNELWLDIDETTHHNMIQELSEQLHEARIHHRRLYNQLSLTEKQKERVDENSVLEDKIYDILCFYVRSKKRSVIDLLDKLRGVKKISQVHLNFIRHYQY